MKQAQVTMLPRVDGEPARHGSALFSQAHAALLQVLPALLCRQARVLAPEAQLLASDGVRRATA
ncbi:hypothetical protein [Janthinobacterium sp. HLX7-2]|uniref:hypothetical protein n=1 Tax=Janthinobacterium sp. HLX7-2 TaxID=1259331 RepID=UPI003F290A9A